VRGAAKPDVRWETRRPSSRKTEDDPILAMAYQIAEVVMDVAGPLFWAALVLAFVTGPLGIELFH
jgi:hypothetical protein